MREGNSAELQLLFKADFEYLEEEETGLSGATSFTNELRYRGLFSAMR